MKRKRKIRSSELFDTRPPFLIPPEKGRWPLPNNSTLLQLILSALLGRFPGKLQQYLRTQIGHIAVVEGQNAEWNKGMENSWREDIILDRLKLIRNGKPLRADHDPSTFLIQYKQIDHYLKQYGFPLKKGARSNWIATHSMPLLLRIFPVQCSCVYPDLIAEPGTLLQRVVGNSPDVSHWVQERLPEWQEAANESRAEFIYTFCASLHQIESADALRQHFKRYISRH